MTTQCANRLHVFSCTWLFCCCCYCYCVCQRLTDRKKGKKQQYQKKEWMRAIRTSIRKLILTFQFIYVEPLRVFVLTTTSIHHTTYIHTSAFDIVSFWNWMNIPSNLCAQHLVRAYNPQPQELVESNRMHPFPYTSLSQRFDRTARRRSLYKIHTETRTNRHTHILEMG